MTPSRESIYAQLFTVLQAVPGLNGSSRVWVPWSQVDPSQQPFVMLRETGGTREWTLGGVGPAKRILIANIIVYQRVGQPDSDAWPATALNNFLDGLEETLMPTEEIGQAQTLNGLVRWCRIEGHQTIYQGDAQQQAMTWLECQMLAMGPGPKEGG
jgi:hypothetical protein